MAVNLDPNPCAILPIAGVELAAVPAGIKAWQRDDMVLLALSPGTQVAAVFTQNAFCAAPVTVAKAHLPNEIRALLINAGNANAGTGEQGLYNARQSCQRLADELGCLPEQVLPFSTGVISEQLPMPAILRGIQAAPQALSADHWLAAARGIMTTDTVPKLYSQSLEIDGKAVSITGMSKGSGMIEPNMATMLAYIATDAQIDKACLQQTLAEVVDDSFNAVTVDGDTSTNDACVLMATGQSGVQLSPAHPQWPSFLAALNTVAQYLAKALARDGEGATKFITVEVEQGESKAECQRVAKKIANSPLVKTAFFASDPNLGRLLMAIGNAGLKPEQINNVSLWLGEVQVLAGAEPAAGYSEAAAAAVMQGEEITVRVSLGRGQARAHAWTCDFSYDYVKINAEYRT